MATESPVSLIGNSGARNWPLSKDSGTFSSSANNLAAQELGLLLESKRFHGNAKSSGPSRSGSAPPSMEGSAISNLIGQHSLGIEGSRENLSSAIENFGSEEQLRADPAYLTYYCSNVNLNPRLPPPLISRERRRLVHHIGGSVNSWNMHAFDDSSKVSLLTPRPSLSTHKEEPEDDRSPRMDSIDMTDRSSGLATGHFTTHSRHKSIVDLIQEDFPRTSSPVYTSQSYATNHIMMEEAPGSDGNINRLRVSPNTRANLSELSTATMGVGAHTRIPGVRSAGSVPSYDLSTALAHSSSSDATVRSHSILKGESSSDDNNVSNTDLACGMVVPESGTIESELKNLKISSDGHKVQHAREHSQLNTLHLGGFSSQVQSGQPQMFPQEMRRVQNSIDHISNGQPKVASVEPQPILQNQGITQHLYGAAPAYGTYYPNLQTSSLFTPQYSLGAYTLNASAIQPIITGFPPQIAIPMPLDGPASSNFSPRASGIPTAGNITQGFDYQHLYKLYGQLGVAMQPSFPDPFYMPYVMQPSADAYTAVGQYDPTTLRSNIIGSTLESNDPHRRPASIAYSPSHRPQFLRTGAVNSPNGRKGSNVSTHYSGSPPNIGVVMQYPTSPLSSPVFQGSPVAGTSSPQRRNDNARLSLGSGRNTGPYFGWQGQRGRDKADDPKYSFLEELKTGKARRFELSDIEGRIVEFSSDQHGSRFIQQKLENCSIEEKASVFKEVLPHASTLMTDVFGNYVIQKFFEHGSSEQRKELANKLAGHIVPLSLQMYGCRVIQKALEVIDLDQKTQLVLELDGHVMRCVRDQNGNHVIQKCIECVPTEKISFIISAFRGQVATLSTHPYGCRVIQRVLEHCSDEMQSHCIVDEILQSACDLAQDQYGNYVMQHVLERGKPNERGQIINKLAGQIVQMSQHKFASNVVEKCLEHGNAEERELLIEEIVGQTEGNDNLLTMMKDQFANYVVQKILETCSDKQREVLLNRISIHLQALKKYTYGKHIVARVEHLCGEETHAAEA